MGATKSRHGCLTAWLILMIVTNFGCIIVYLLERKYFSNILPEELAWVIPFVLGFLLFNLFCAIALFQWKKWGFWGLCVSAAISFVTNLLIGLGIISALSGPISIACLFGVLHIGKQNKGWPQLD